MNNTKTVSAIVAVLIAAALVVGGTSAAMTTGHSAFAWKQDSYKKKGDNSYKKDGQDGYKKQRQDSYKKDTYMKGGENSYKKGKQANGNGYGNGNTDTIQTTTQNGKVSGFHNTLEQEASNVICTHPGEGVAGADLGTLEGSASCTNESG
ncbi:MAG: hypothetical protein WA421_05470 [Nitrososphaeraceae archaeon]